MKAELDEARLSESQLKEKLTHQQELLRCKSEELRKMSDRVHESLSSEMLALQIELSETENAKVIYMVCFRRSFFILAYIFTCFCNLEFVLRLTKFWSNSDLTQNILCDFYA